MDVSAEDSVALPARLRPTPDQVCHWYEQNLRAMGAEVQRVAPGRLEFDLPLSQTFFAWNPLASLAPLTRGELEVADTADGFEVLLTGKARAWITWLPVAVFAFGTGGLLFLGTSTRYYLAAGAFLLLGLAWVRTKASLHRFLEATNAEIAESFAAVPPPPRGEPGEPPPPPVETTVEWTGDLTVRTVRGELSARQLLDAIAAAHAEEPTRYVLWDFTAAQLDRLTASEVRGLAEAEAQRARGRPGWKTALVFSPESALGLGAMFDELRNVLGAPMEYRSFRHRAAAMAWLRGEGP
jgi:hypothetical protein